MSSNFNTQTRSHTGLFIHGGPGGNAFVEREWLNKTIPLLWWDQPKNFTNKNTAFDELVEKTISQVRTMASIEPISIVAHSFGGHIALDVLNEVPSLIKSLTLLGSSIDPPRCFVHLAHKLLAKNKTLITLKKSLEQAEQTWSFTHWQHLIGEIIQTPDYIRYYWSNDKAFKRFITIVQKAPPIHIDSFFSLMRCVFDRHKKIMKIRYPLDSKVSIFFGQDDPLIVPSDEKSSWNTVFPNASIDTLPTGHFIHLETDPKIWFKP